MLTLWTLLNAICFFIPVVAAIEEAKAARAGLGGYALAIAIGLALGGGCALAMWTVGRRVGSALQAYPEPRREWYFRVLYSAALLWILMVGFLANWTISAAMRLVV